MWLIAVLSTSRLQQRIGETDASPPSAAPLRGGASGGVLSRAFVIVATRFLHPSVALTQHSAPIARGDVGTHRRHVEKRVRVPRFRLRYAAFPLARSVSPLPPWRSAK
jgi:hypothetical protein